MLKRVNLRCDVPIYEQIENTVRFGIARGELTDGTKLPTVRELSQSLDVNPNTVAKAYRDLEVMGLLVTRRGRGTLIKKGVQVKCSRDCRTATVSRLHEVTQEAKAAGITKRELKRILRGCLKSKAAPYDETPKEVLSLAK